MIKGIGLLGELILGMLGDPNLRKITLIFVKKITKIEFRNIELGEVI